jgi:Zn-dependent protease
MFNEVEQRTPFDLNFYLFRIPIRVHPFFWIVAALLGNWVFRVWGFPYLLIWIGCVFFSILLHELGHALTGRLFGNRPHILLLTFGGLAIGATDPHNKRWQRIAVIFAGPGIQLLLYAILWVVVWCMSPPGFPLRGNLIWSPLFLIPQVGEPVAVTLCFLMIINLIWPLFNLLPIWPLDGGQITREVLDEFRPRDGIIISLVISAVVSGVLCIHMILAEQHRPLPFLEWVPGGYFNAMFMLLFCVVSLQQLQIENARRSQRYDRDDRFPWE